MSRKVGIVAVAQTKYEEAKWNKEFGELMLEPVESLLEQTGLTFARDGSGIDASVSASQDHVDGRTISALNAIDVLGGHLREDEKVAGDGAAAFIYAYEKILSEHCDTMLVGAYTKESQTNMRLVENAGLEPIYTRWLGLDFQAANAMQAKRYMYKYGITKEQAAKVVVKNRGNALRNSCAQAPAALSVDDVFASPMVASPLRFLDIKPSSDGACALILACEEKAKELTDNPIWVKGIGYCNDAHYLGFRDLADCDALKIAAKQAYNMAGMHDPRKEIDLIELSEECSYQELLWTEGLGLCEGGSGGDLIDSGFTAMEGQVPVNPSGGLLSGVPVIVSGLNRTVEAAMQLKGDAGDHQISGAKTALAHGISGACGQAQYVIILGK